MRYGRNENIKFDNNLQDVSIFLKYLIFECDVQFAINIVLTTPLNTFAVNIFFSGGVSDQVIFLGNNL
jgi:hypothetical protein